MLKRIVFLLLILAGVLFLPACSEPADYSHAEMRISLPESFSRIEKENYDAAFSDGRIIVALLRLSFAAAYNDGIPETMNSNEFARFWMNRSGNDAAVQLYEGVDYAEYSEEVEGEEYYYVTAFYRSRYAFFVVVFAARADSEADFRSEIFEYMTSVSFSDEQ